MRSQLVRILALFALCLHVAAPTVAMAAAADQIDVSGFVCVTPGTGQTDAQARMVERLSELLESDNETPQSDDGTCSHCIVAASIILPDQAEALALRYAVEAQAFSSFDPGLMHEPRGPPVGATGPPHLQLI
ncbi:MAG: DUF2946 family protein [Pseudomonadota bacterium]